MGHVWDSESFLGLVGGEQPGKEEAETMGPGGGSCKTLHREERGLGG